MTFEFDADAKAEFFDTIAFYESHGKGIGEDFSREVMSAVSQIVVHPEIEQTRRRSSFRLLHGPKA